MALVTFFGELDATFGDEDAAFGQGEGFEAGDDLEEFFELAMVVVAAGGEFEKAEFELFFGGGANDLVARNGIGILVFVSGDDFVAGLLVIGDAVVGVEFGEAGGADFEVEVLKDFLGGFFVGGGFFAEGDDGFFGLSGEGGEKVGNAAFWIWERGGLLIWDRGLGIWDLCWRLGVCLGSRFGRGGKFLR